MALENRAYAKVVLALIELMEASGETPDTFAPPRATEPGEAGPPPAPPPTGRVAPRPNFGPLAGSPAAVARRRGAVAVVRVPAAPPSAVHGWRAAVGGHPWQWFWHSGWWAALAVFGVLGLLRFPDLLVVVPSKILALAQMYFCFVLDRMWHRVEAEALASVFGHTVLSASSASTAVHISGSSNTMHPSHLASFPMLGWLVAFVSWYRRQ